MNYLKKGIVCELSDGRRAEAKILSTDARWDIALIKVELLGLKPVNLDGGKTGRTRYFPSCFGPR